MFNISRSPCYNNENKTKRKLAAHGDNCSIVNCRTKISRDIWDFLRYFRVFISLFHSFLLHVVFSLYVYVCLPWLRVFLRFFFSCKTNARIKPRKDGARPALFLIFELFYIFFVLFYVFLCCSMYCLFCDVLCIVCVCMCTELLPPGGYPIAVTYIISYISLSRNPGWETLV